MKSQSLGGHFRGIMENFSQLTSEKNDKLYDCINEIWQEKNSFSFDPANPKITLHQATYGPEEIMAFLDCLLGVRVTMGPVVNGFEKLFCDTLNYLYGVTSNSGSSANLLAVAALSNPVTERGLRPGDEVIVPALSWSTTIWPLIQHQLVPVFVDVDPDTLNIDPIAIEKAITSKTKAVMIVPVYGNPCDMASIVDLCQKHKLWLIEDCCESMGAEYDGQSVGSFGDVGTFSFYFSHHITTLEGGITVTHSSELDDLMRILRSHGWSRQTKNPHNYSKHYPDIDERFLFVNQGYNLRMTDPQAAMGFHQLPKLKPFIEQRTQSASYFSEHMAPYENWIKLQQTTPNGKHAWFGLCLTLTENAPFSTKQIRHHLEKHGIETRPIICGNIARQPAMKLYKHRVSGELKFSDAVMERGFAIGNHQDVCEQAQKHIIDCFKSLFNKFAKAA